MTLKIGHCVWLVDGKPCGAEYFVQTPLQKVCTAHGIAYRDARDQKKVMKQRAARLEVEHERK